jgi:hypothetical protein
MFGKALLFVFSEFSRCNNDVFYVIIVLHLNEKEKRIYHKNNKQPHNTNQSHNQQDKQRQKKYTARNNKQISTDIIDRTANEMKLNNSSPKPEETGRHTKQ